MNPQDLDRIRFVTRHFQELQGLRSQVPTGMMMLGLGLVLTFERLPIFLLDLALLGGALVLQFRSKSYYREIFGEVERPVGTSRQIPYLLIPFLLFLFAFCAPGLHFSIVRVLYALFGSFFLGTWLWRGCRSSQAHNLVLGVLLSGLAAPGGSSGFVFPALARQGISDILSGTAFILAGLLDHRLLVREMGRLAAPSREIETAEMEEVQR